MKLGGFASVAELAGTEAVIPAAEIGSGESRSPALWDL